jgi:hypothetical protein
LYRVSFSKKVLAQRAIGDYVSHDNSEPSYSLLGYILPIDFGKKQLKRVSF